MIEVYRQAESRLYTQDEVIEILRDKGYTDVTKRTLGFWRQRGDLPLLELYDADYTEGRVWCYRAPIITQIETLLKQSTRKNSPTEVVAILELEGHIFTVEKITITRNSGELKLVYHTTDGLLIKSLGEGELPDAFTAEGNHSYS